MYQYVTHFTANDLMFMAQGAGITLVLSIASGILGTILGFCIGWARSTRSRILYYILGAYIDVIRSIPLIIQFVLFNSFMAIAGYPLNPFLSGLVTLSIYISGYVAEVVKAGIESVPKTTRMAARGLGMTYLAGYWLVSQLAPGLELLPLHQRPAVIYSVGLLLLGGQLMSVGFLAELLIAYQDHDHKSNYTQN